MQRRTVTSCFGLKIIEKVSSSFIVKSLRCKSPQLTNIQQRATSLEEKIKDIGRRQRFDLSSFTSFSFFVPHVSVRSCGYCSSSRLVNTELSFSFVDVEFDVTNVHRRDSISRWSVSIRLRSSSFAGYSRWRSYCRRSRSVELYILRSSTFRLSKRSSLSLFTSLSIDTFAQSTLSTTWRMFVVAFIGKWTQSKSDSSTRIEQCSFDDTRDARLSFSRFDQNSKRKRKTTARNSSLLWN